jgi:PIN domain nuclease of toxin-antitoxin system
VLSLLQGALAARYPEMAGRLADPATVGFVSVASLWETAIKARLGKLDPGMPLQDIVGYLEAVGLSILPVEARHVVTATDPEPETRDPFDRLLLAQCQVESLRLATVDRALVAHPLALPV